MMGVLKMKLIETLTQSTDKIICNADFKNFARKRPNYFTRVRKMPFEDVITFMLFHLKSSIPTALRRFFHARGSKIHMTQQSLCEAKEKIKFEAFRYLFIKTMEVILQHRTEKWNGHRIFAVDGTKITLPADKKLLKHFGGTGRNASSPTAQASTMFDVLNDTIVDAQIAPISTDERTLALKHLDSIQHLCSNDRNLVVYDRGYPSFELIQELESKNFFYLMRVKRKFSAKIDEQTASDGIVDLEKDGCRIRARVLKFALPSGQIETLITNVTDEQMGGKRVQETVFHALAYRDEIQCDQEQIAIGEFFIPIGRRDTAGILCLDVLDQFLGLRRV